MHMVVHLVNFSRSVLFVNMDHICYLLNIYLQNINTVIDMTYYLSI